MRQTVKLRDIKYIKMGIEPARASDADMSKVPLSDATDVRVTIDVPAEVSDPACPSFSSFLPSSPYPLGVPSSPLACPSSLHPPPSFTLVLSFSLRSRPSLPLPFS
eukprot:GHVU01102242.1.p2 GENE.GHVU01102242.1~~GHVU01102242.1.p2  ORF type:complete len:106 (-),score=11.18 GHVU01102242.1:1639-1956(-)